MISHEQILKIQKKLNKKTNYKNKSIDFYIKYFTKLKVFKRSNLEFNPVSGAGFSYNWYQISKRIGKTLVLNTYRYSVTTAKQVKLLQELFYQLGLDYIEIEAPRGLQNLDDAMIRHCQELAKILVKNKYGRIEYPAMFHRESIKFLSRYVPKPDLEPYIQIAEDSRTRRLKLKREHKFQLMQMASFNDVREVSNATL